MLRTSPGLIALVLIAGAACRRPGPPLPVWTGGDAGGALEPLPDRSPGCARADAPTGALDRTVKVAGHDRRYLMAVPRQHGPQRALPVIFHFHGREWMDRPPPRDRKLAGGLAALPAVASGAIFVAPRGIPFPGDRMIGWYDGCPSDDVDFFDAMLAAIGESHCIDPRAVLVTGISWGAETALGVACCRGEKVRAVAAASGSDLSSMPVCPARRMPALRATYAANGDGVYSKAEFAASVQFFRQVHHCAPETDPVGSDPCVAYRGCAQPVVACGYRNFGHRYPNDFAEATWDWFTSLLAR